MMIDKQTPHWNYWLPNVPGAMQPGMPLSNADPSVHTQAYTKHWRDVLYLGDFKSEVNP